MTFTYTGTSGNDYYSYKDSDSLLAYGLAGNDTLYGAYGVNNATLYGGAGNDMLDGYGDNTILFGGAGNDSLSGTGDVLEVGGAGNDWLTVGKTGDGTLFGGVGDDTLDDYSIGNNHLLGGRGNDILIGFRGYDTLTGGFGADIFQVFDASLSLNDGYTTITDFSRAQGDKIQVYGSASNYSLDQSQNLSGQLALDTAIYYSNVLIAVLQDTTIASLSSDFIFSGT